jgi:hypothetical protein
MGSKKLLALPLAEEPSRISQKTIKREESREYSFVRMDSFILLLDLIT